MIKHVFAWIAALLLTACAQTPTVGETEVRYGRVTRIDNVQIDSSAHMGLGSIIGSVAGGVLGYQIGGGTGHDVAAVAGALGGAALGTAAQSRMEKQSGQHITVALNNGVVVGITQPASNLRVGDQVRIDGSGNSARVTRY
ncbi:glycine zipper 2TM domain-containing protein [Noviherbaspirillum cavernae]|nr:glycine zipper domain-containing protein [Noviherbaspirillum cavernae]